MNIGGVTERLVDFSRALVGYITGRLGHANVVANIFMAGMPRSAVADAAGLGSVEIKIMTVAGYDLDFSAALSCAAATIGPIITSEYHYGCLFNDIQHLHRAALHRRCIPGDCHGVLSDDHGLCHRTEEKVSRGPMAGF